jgi:hypothetical protein
MLSDGSSSMSSAGVVGAQVVIGVADLNAVANAFPLASSVSARYLAVSGGLAAGQIGNAAAISSSSGLAPSVFVGRALGPRLILFLLFISNLSLTLTFSSMVSMSTFDAS